MKDVPRSQEFDDIYFSTQGGLEETAHIFLRSNDLPDAWQDRQSFTIFEMSFGKGLNFFSTWKLFEETAKAGQTLDFISVEKYPMTAIDIEKALNQWSVYFGGRIKKFETLYPIRIGGFHRLKISPQITLTLIFDDVNDALPQVNAAVDYWFLDGVAPAKKPQIWTDIVFENMARLSTSGANFSSSTMTNEMCDAISKAGFEVVKQKVFDHKSEMIKGRFNEKGIKPAFAVKQNKNVAIIGGGLAGTATAYVLKQYGFIPKIYEQAATLGMGASGNNIGYYNPRFTAQRDEISDFYAPAYAQLISTVRDLGSEVDYNPCGTMHLMNTPERHRRFSKMKEKWNWHDDHAQVLDAQQASDTANFKVKDDCLYLADSGSLCPQKLCEYYARDIDIEFNSNIEDYKNLKEDIVILCNASAIKNYKNFDWLPMEGVRGQVTNLKSNSAIENLKCNLHYGGNLSAPVNGLHSIGSTFQKWFDHQNVLQKDHNDNIEVLKNGFPFLQDIDFDVDSGWAGIRCATNDRYPVIGKVPFEENIYISTAFGSHGIVGSIMGAHHLADLLRGGAGCLSSRVQYCLSPQRFIDRAKKKGRVFA